MSDKISSIRVKNFLRLIEEHFDGSVNAFAKKFGLSPTPYYMIINGSRQFGSKVAHTVEQLLKLRPGQLDAENGATEYEIVVQIPLYGNILSADCGQNIFKQEIIRHHTVELNDIKRFGWKEENLCMFEVHGDSMAPELQDGQRIIVDTSQTEIVDVLKIEIILRNTLIKVMN
ncbi:MAG: prophage transcriptional regulator [Burkholderiales bacterium]|nr:prophage transcriptional regulator [Burkholderiales bacterium]